MQRAWVCALIIVFIAFVDRSALAQVGSPSPAPSAPQITEPPASQPVGRETPLPAKGLAPKHARLALALSGAAAAALAVLFFLLGDSISPDFPTAQLGATSAIAMVGAGIGAITAAAVGNDDDRPLRMPAARPLVSLVLWPTGNSVIGNSRPWTTGASFDPAFSTGPRLQLEPHFGFSFSLGNRVDVDPRPQVAAAGSQFPVALTQSFLRFDVALETALRLGPLNARGVSPVELRVRHSLDLRRQALQPAASGEVVTYTLIALPLIVGMRWNISARQGFTLLAGPRIDNVTSGARGAPLQGSAALLASIYAEAWYFIDLLEFPIADKLISWRLTLGYQHIRAYNSGFSAGAVIGFFGPLQGALDVRFPITQNTLAGQVGLGAWLGDGGGAVLRVGLDFGGWR